MQVCNNGIWAIGEIAINCPEQVRPHLKELMKSFSSILSVDIFKVLQANQKLLYHLGRTVAITLGRLASMDPEGCAFCLPSIIKPWCIALRYISGTEEKV